MFLFLFFFWDLYNSNVGTFDMVPEVSSLVAQRLKHLPAMQKTWVRSLGWEDPLEKEMATHSSVLAWRIPGTGEPGGLCLWGRTESDTTEVTLQQQKKQRKIKGMRKFLKRL